MNMDESSLPEIAPRDVFLKINSPAPFILLDVREPYELSLARIQDTRVQFAPMSEIAHFGLEALPEGARDPDAEIVVFCHQGIRSAQVTAWLLAQGWNNIQNLSGGIDAYAREVDPRIGLY